MAREITIALVQIAPKLPDREANLRKMGDFVERICTEQRTDLIVFPELSYTGTELGLRATDLAERVNTGSFNQDLYDRLKVFELTIPPLRERKDDIHPLCRYFFDKYRKELGKSVVSISPEVVKILVEFKVSPF